MAEADAPAANRTDATIQLAQLSSTDRAPNRRDGKHRREFASPLEFAAVDFLEESLGVEFFEPAVVDDFFGFHCRGPGILFRDVLDDDLESFERRIGFAVEFFLRFGV